MARRYGERAQDLAISFWSRTRPALITEILSACLQSPDGLAFSQTEIGCWTVKKRLQTLLMVVRATTGTQVVATERCPHASCAQPVELDLDLSAFSSGPLADASPDAFEWTANEGHRLIIRLPTGRDQLEWLAGREEDSVPLPVLMASRLVSSIDGQRPPDGWRVPETWVEGIGTSLEQHDCLTALQLDVQCPCCLRKSQVDLDLADLLVRQLAEVQMKLLDDIHRLATVYHWSEEQILAIPTWRRALYLKRLNTEALA